MLCLVPFCGIEAQNSVSSVLPPVDFRALVSKSDLVFSEPVNTGEEGMPVGNGVMGTLVWTTPSALRYQLNRVDVFASNEGSNNFAQRHSDYCGGVGFLDIDFPGYDEVFTGNDFHQKLSCYGAVVTTGGKNVKTETFVWSDGDVMAVKVQDNRKGLPVVVRLRTLRPPVTGRGDHRAISSLKAEGTNQMTLTQTFSEGSFICKSAMAVTVAGAEAKVWQANDAEMTLTVKPSDSGVFYIFVSSAATFDRGFDVAADALEKLAKAKFAGYDAMLASHGNWWKNYWEQSFISMNSSDGVADDVTLHYNYFMYIMGSASRGEYEFKFNGMLWSTGGDKRQWGSQFWGANQSCFYNGLFPANRPELMQPLFKMYSLMIPSLERAAVQQWGSRGIFIPETVAFDGLTDMPDDIAAEMRDIYLARKAWSEVSPEFMRHAATKKPHNSRWNWKNDDGWKDGVWQFSDKGGGGFAQVNHIFSRGAKIAYQYWMQYEYSQDREWLATQAYPVLKGVAEFYRNFPNLKMEQDGKYHIHHVNDNESVWGGHNTVEEISSIMGLFPVAIKAATILNVDADLRKEWAELLANLSPLALSSDYPELAEQPLTFVRSLQPVRRGPATGLPDPNTMPIWFFDLLTLESNDIKMMEIANNTYNAYFRRRGENSGNFYQEMSGINKDARIGILSKLPVTGTQMGRKDAARYLIPSQIRYDGGSVMRNRLDLSEGAQTTNVQRLGRVADALHNALCQSIPAKPGEETIIRVFPALPDEWDAQFTLLCRGNFMVTSSFKKGTVEFVEIKSQSGKQCKLRNPWGTEEVTIYRNGKKLQNSKGNLISFSTKAGEVFVILKSDEKLTLSGNEKKSPLMDLLPIFTASNVPEFSVDEIMPSNPRNIPDRVAAPNLPGNGLARHPMLYIGEGCNIMFLVNEGKVIWTFNTGDGWEYDDVWMMTNGNIVFSRQWWAGEITPQKRYVWRIDTEDDEEIHVTQPIGLDRVMLVVNGKPPKVKIYNKKTGKIDFEHELDYEADKQVHAQFRRARITDKNTLLVPYLMLHKVVEYDLNDNFKPIWEYGVHSPWAAIRLKNGNTLITNERDKLTLEVNPAGKTVWSFALSELPEEYAMPNTQSCVRLDNGNTIICSRGNNGKAPQLVEITPDKKVVWALDDWKNLGQATAVQILTETGIPENPGECQR